MFKRFKDRLSKIRLKVWLRVTLLLLPVFFIISFVEKKSAERLCKSLTIRIEEHYDNHFLDEKDIQNLMTLRGKEFVVGESLKNIDLNELEARIKSNPFVDDAEVHKDLEGNLAVDVLPCQPMARIVVSGGNDYYISNKGKLLPMSQKFTARVLIVDGPFVGKLIRTQLDTNAITKPYFDLITRIEGDEFLKMQVHQMTINSSGEVDLYSQVGNHVIELGEPSDLDTKIRYIKLFYNEILPAKGWNYYNKICLKYENQIICEQ